MKVLGVLLLLVVMIGVLLLLVFMMNDGCFTPVGCYDGCLLLLVVMMNYRCFALAAFHCDQELVWVIFI